MTHLHELVGKHMLTAAARTDVRHPFDSDANGIMWFMDNKIYAVFEDPDDGYRSHAGPIFVATGDASSVGGIEAEYIQREVIARMAPKAEDDWYESEVLELIDVQNGHTWLRVGTRDVNDYYPSFVAEWHPMQSVDPRAED